MIKYGKSLAIAALTGLALLSAAPALSNDDYPKQTVRIVVGFGAGGQTDLVARLVADRLSARLGQTFVIDNKPGASGIIGVSFASKAPGDGYTLLVSSNTAMGVLPALYESLPYNVSDFEPLGEVSAFPMVLLVNPKIPIHSVKDLVDFLRKNPDRRTYSTPSQMFQLAAELLAKRIGIEMTNIPYRSGPESTWAAASGEVPVTWAGGGPTMEAIESGKLRAIAITGKERMKSLPDVATFAEQGFSDFDFLLWTGAFAPKNTPPAILKKLEETILALNQEPEFLAKLGAILGVPPVMRSAGELRVTIAKELPFWASAVESAKMPKLKLK